ncbi:DUF4262 domain-containing protein [Pyxidicoccus sp. 3LG]
MPPRTLNDELDSSERKVLTDIREHGWHVVKVFNDDDAERGFAFTIGLPTTFQHPEFIIIGLKLGLMHILLNNLGAELQGGRRFKAGETYDGLLEGYQCTFRKVSRHWYREYLGYATWYHQGMDYEVLQVVWPDQENRLPWHPSATAAFREQQPVLEQPPPLA